MYDIKGDLGVGRDISIGRKASIGSGTADVNAILDLISTDKVFIPPRMTTTQKLAISSISIGSVVFDTTLDKLSLYTNLGWIELSAGITKEESIAIALIFG